MNYNQEQKQAVDNILEYIKPFLHSDNSPESILYILRREANKMYDEAFIKGTENVLEGK